MISADEMRKTATSARRQMALDTVTRERQRELVTLMKESADVGLNYTFIKIAELPDHEAIFASARLPSRRNNQLQLEQGVVVTVETIIQQRTIARLVFQLSVTLSGFGYRSDPIYAALVSAHNGFAR